MAAWTRSCSARARAKASGGFGSSCARRQWVRAGAADSVQTPVAREDAVGVEPRPLGEQAQARGRGPQRARDDHQVPGLRPAPAKQPSPCPSSVTSTTTGPVVSETLPPDDVHSGFGRTFEEAVVEARPRSDSGVVGGRQRLTVAWRGTPAIAAMSDRLTLRALRPRRRGGHHSRRKWTPSTRQSVVIRVRGPSPRRPRRRRSRSRPRARRGCGTRCLRRPRSPMSLTGVSGLITRELPEARRKKAPRLCRVEGDLNLVTRWEPCAPL